MFSHHKPFAISVISVIKKQMHTPDLMTHIHTLYILTNHAPLYNTFSHLCHSHCFPQQQTTTRNKNNYSYYPMYGANQNSIVTCIWRKRIKLTFVNVSGRLIFREWNAKIKVKSPYYGNHCYQWNHITYINYCVMHDERTAEPWMVKHNRFKRTANAFIQNSP